MKKFRHWACNLVTGEVLGADNAKALNRYTNAISKRDKSCRWVYAHYGEQSLWDKIREKY